MTIWVV